MSAGQSLSSRSNANASRPAPQTMSRSQDSTQCRPIHLLLLLRLELKQPDITNWPRTFTSMASVKAFTSAGHRLVRVSTDTSTTSQIRSISRENMKVLDACGIGRPAKHHRHQLERISGRTGQMLHCEGRLGQA